MAARGYAPLADEARGARPSLLPGASYRFEAVGMAEAASIIARAFRRYRLIFNRLGPTIFARKGGGMADYGNIYFPGNNRSAPFITVADTTSAMLLSNFMQLYWKVDRPDLIISVTGGAQDFVLNPRLKRVFDRGLTSAASSTRAWVITGGTDTGVMKLVASAFVEYSVTTPLIAIVSHGCVHGHGRLVGSRGSTTTYTCDQPASAQGAPLNPAHTHYVLVDDGRVAPQAWGGEIGLRSRLESTYVQKLIPMVLLVAQGGPGTLETVLASAKLSQAILIVKGSGGAADAVADYVESGSTSDPKFSGEKLQKTLSEIKRIQDASDGNLITIFSLDKDVEMSVMLLHALTRVLGMQSSSQKARRKFTAAADSARTPRDGSLTERSGSEGHIPRALVLAINWNRVDIASRLIQEMSAALTFTYGHHCALQLVLEKQRGKLFLLLTACPGFTLRSVNMCRLYLLEDKYNLLRSNTALQGRIADKAAAITQTSRDKFTGEPTNTHGLYVEVVGPFLCSIVPQLRGPLAESEVTALDLFLWAAIIGNDELMLELWKRTRKPLHAALWGAHLQRRVTEKIQFGKAECISRSQVLESWACGLLDVIPSASDAYLILGDSTHEENSLMDSAMLFGMKSFLAHKHCQSMMDATWLGELSDRSQALSKQQHFLALWLYVLLPPLNPYLYSSRDPHAHQGSQVSDVSSLVAAMMYTHRLARAEARRAGSAEEAAAAYKEVGSSSNLRNERFTAILGLARIFEAQEKVNEEEEQAQGLKELRTDHRVGGLFKHVEDFYAIPFTKFVVRLTMHLIMLANYTMLLMTLSSATTVAEHGVPRLSWPEICFALQALGNLLDQSHQKLVLERLNCKPMVNFGSLFVLEDFIMRSAGILRVVSLVGDAHSDRWKYAYTTYQVSISCNVVIAVFRTFHFRTIHQDFGVLVIMVEGMVADLRLFMELFGLIAGGFLLSFVGLTEWHSLAEDPEAVQLTDPWAVITATFWSTYGEFDLDLFSSAVPFGQPVLFLYGLISTIILVNLLVAMFSDTYANIKANSELEYHFQRCNMVFLYDRIVLALPPPFNLPLILPDLLSRWRAWCGGGMQKPQPGLAQDVQVKAASKDDEDDGSAPSAKDDGHKSASIYMESYLRACEAKELTSSYRLQVQMHEKTEEMRAVQDNTMDILKDINLSLSSLRAECIQNTPDQSSSTAAGLQRDAVVTPASGRDDYARDESVRHLKQSVALIGESVGQLNSKLDELSAQLETLGKAPLKSPRRFDPARLNFLQHSGQSASQ